MPADRVIELHGNASYATCLECAERHELEALKESFLKARRDLPSPTLRGGS